MAMRLFILGHLMLGRRSIDFRCKTILMWLALAALSSPPVQAAKGKGGDLCNQGRELYASGDVLKAIQALGKCVEKNPKQREAWTALANASLEAGRFPEAVEAFSKAHALKSGDETFLQSYLTALDGAGKTEEQIPILRALLALKKGDRKIAQRFLSILEQSGSQNFSDDYLAVLEILSEGPAAQIQHREKLAALYFKRGQSEKAEAEYRGLLEKRPESGDYWAGLGAAQAHTDAAAAAECYRKAVLFTDQAGQRTAYQAEIDKLSKGPSKPEESKQSNVEVTQAKPSPKAAPASAKPTPAVAVAPASSKQSTAASSSNATAAVPAQSSNASEKASVPVPAPAFNAKAFQDSVYHAELEKRMAEVHKQEAEAQAKAEADKEQQDKLTKEAAEKDRQDKLAKQEQEKKQKEEKDKKDKQDKLAQEQKAKEEKQKQEQADREAQAKAKADKEQQDKLAKEAAEKDRQDKLAKQEQDKKQKEEKDKQDKLAQEQKAKEEKQKQEQADREAQAKAKAEKEQQEKLAKEAAEKAKAEKEQQEKLSKEAAEKAKAEKEQQEKLAKEAAEKAKAEKERQEKLAKEAEEKAKAEKALQEKLALEAAEKAKAEKERIAREQEQKRAEEEKARKLKEENDRREQLARERQERYDHALALFKSDKLDSAALLFKTVLADSPKADAFYFAGQVSLAKSEYAKALDLFSKGPQDKIDLDGLRGKALMSLGKNKEALQALESQYKKSGGDDLLESLYLLKKKMGDEAGSMVYLEKLSAQRPGVEKYQVELAGYYDKQGDHAKALDRYLKVFAINASQPDADYFLGMDWYKQADHKRAVPLLEKAVAAYPDRLDAREALYRGRLALARGPGHVGDLGKALEDVLKIAPDDADAALGLAKLRFEDGSFPAAEKYFRIGIPESKDGLAWAAYGRCLLELKKPDEAAVALQKAVDLHVESASIRIDLARINIDKGNLDRAESLMKDLARQNPTAPEPLYWQGQIAAKRQQTAVAEEFFRKADQMKPNDGRFAEALARAYHDRDEYKAAIPVLASAGPNLTVTGKLLWADCLAQGGEESKAMELYTALYLKDASATLMSRRVDLLVRMGKADQAVELAHGAPSRENPEVRFSLAKAQLALQETHVLKGDMDEAVDLMKKVVGTNNHSPEFHYYLGLAYFGQNRLKKALDEFTDALTFRVDYPEALYRKGVCLIKLDRAKEAEDAFGELSQHADAVWKSKGLYGLALMFEADGKPEAVEHHLERALAASPLPDAMAYMSRVMLRQGKIPEAQDWAKRALAADPTHEEATVALADALSAGKRQDEAMALARQGLKAKPLSCGLLVQSAKLSFQAGKLDSTLASGNNAIKNCPEEPMGYYYAGIATHGTNHPKEAKQYFKSFKKYGGDAKLIPEN